MFPDEPCCSDQCLIPKQSRHQKTPGSFLCFFQWPRVLLTKFTNSPTVVSFGNSLEPEVAEGTHECRFVWAEPCCSEGTDQPNTCHLSLPLWRFLTRLECLIHHTAQWQGLPFTFWKRSHQGKPIRHELRFLICALTLFFGGGGGGIKLMKCF